MLAVPRAVRADRRSVLLLLVSAALLTLLVCLGNARASEATSGGHAVVHHALEQELAPATTASPSAGTAGPSVRSFAHAAAVVCQFLATFLGFLLAIGRARPTALETPILARVGTSPAPPADPPPRVLLVLLQSFRN
ncbi:MAG: hypothetical protein RMK01_12325 [Thermomicrobium sp.]|nr:hypothetical protein [Thermomicrobium sp.]MDW8060849.1 hypothetical protein [Thermomicrobium sp.]